MFGFWARFLLFYITGGIYPDSAINTVLQDVCGRDTSISDASWATRYGIKYAFPATSVPGNHRFLFNNYGGVARRPSKRQGKLLARCIYRAPADPRSPPGYTAVAMTNGLVRLWEAYVTGGRVDPPPFSSLTGCHAGFERAQPLPCRSLPSIVAESRID